MPRAGTPRPRTTARARHAGSTTAARRRRRSPERTRASPSVPDVAARPGRPGPHGEGGAGAPPAAARRVKPSLRAELLFNLAFLAAGALLLGIGTALLAPVLVSRTLGAAMVTALVAADVAIFILFGRYLVSRHVTGPLDALVGATDAVAGGRLDARGPAA